jgi:hypothetical protein
MKSSDLNQSAPAASLEAIDAWIRQGKLKVAARRLKEVAPGPGTEARLEFARLCRRAGVPMLGLRALKPIVRPGARLRGDAGRASPAALTEYAALLLRLGAATEATRWLARVRTEDTPDKLLFEAFACFRQWDYAAAIAPLERYCQDPRVTPYSRLVGQVNWAAALVLERQDAQAERLLGRLAQATLAGGHDLLYGNTLETWIQLRVFQGRPGEALEFLAEVERRGFIRPGAEGILFRKWAAIARRCADPDDRRARRSLADLAVEARGLGSWEVARDCDFHEARLTRDRALMERLYFGTPYPAYRARIVALGFEPAQSVVDWCLGPPGVPKPRDILDVRTGVVAGRARDELRPGSLGLRLIQTLASDFYRPWRLAELHAALYPGQHFDPESSSLRVHQLLRRARAALAQARSSIRIEENRETYRLASGAPAIVRLGSIHPTGLAGRAQGIIDRLVAALGSPTRSFSSSEAARILELDPRTVRRALRQAVSDGRLIRVGLARASRYAIAVEQ